MLAVCRRRRHQRVEIHVPVPVPQHSTSGGTMKRLVIILALAAMSCGDDANHEKRNDAANNVPPQGTFAAFVIDLVKNRTADDTDPVEAASFLSLPDPDQDNERAFDSLFE